jgi:hypothetical protein
VFIIIIIILKKNGMYYLGLKENMPSITFRLSTLLCRVEMNPSLVNGFYTSSNGPLTRSGVLFINCYYPDRDIVKYMINLIWSKHLVLSLPLKYLNLELYRRAQSPT